MNRDVVFTEIKSGMKQVIDNIKINNLDNLNQDREELEKYFSFLWHFTQFLDKEVAEERVEQLTFDLQDTPEDPLQEEHQDHSKLYTFVRKLKGGNLEGTSIIIPETLVRILGVEHGDTVKATEKESQPGYHDFEIVEKGSGGNPDWRIQFDYCPVQYDASINKYIVEKTLVNGGEKIRVPDMELPQTVLLKDDDVFDFKIKEGDVVDLAYSTQGTHYSRVIWKHQTDGFDAHVTPKPSSHYKEGSEEEVSTSLDKIEANFEGKKILVIGCEPRKALFQQQIESRGGEFIWAEGLEGKDQLEKLIKKADVTVFLIRFMKHSASKVAVEMAKKHNKPFASIETLGVKTLLEGTKEALSS